MENNINELFKDIKKENKKFYIRNINTYLELQEINPHVINAIRILCKMCLHEHDFLIFIHDNFVVENIGLHQLYFNELKKKIEQKIHLRHLLQIEKDDHTKNIIGSYIIEIDLWLLDRDLTKISKENKFFFDITEYRG